MSFVDELIACEPFSYTKDIASLFLRAMNESVSWHYEHCREYRNYLEFSCFQPRIESEEDLARLPFLHVQVYKEYDLKSVPEDQIVLSLTSSGTTGKKSKNFLDAISLARVRKIAHNIYRALGMVNEAEQVNYCCFTYDPHVAKDLGTAFTDELLTGFTGKKRVYYAFQYNPANGRFEINREEVVNILEEYEKEGIPIRILGFPAFIYDILEYCQKKHHRKFHFHPHSFVMTGGGWKRQEDKKVSREFFVHFIHEMTSIPCENMRDMFGMIEHGVPYVECTLGNMHIPIYSRVFIKDPNTLQHLPYGHIGLASFVTPYWHSYPALAILMNDFALLEPSCACGIQGEVLKVVGRAGISKHTGCALHAEKTVQTK